MFPSHEFCDASSSYRFCVSQKDKNHISLSYLFPCYGYAFCGGVIKMTPIQRTPMWPLGFKLASKIYISPNAKFFFLIFRFPFQVFLNLSFCCYMNQLSLMSSIGSSKAEVSITHRPMVLFYKIVVYENCIYVFHILASAIVAFL